MLTRYIDLVTIKILPYEEQLFVANGRLVPDGLITEKIESRANRRYRYLYYNGRSFILYLNDFSAALASPNTNEWHTPLKVMQELLGKTHSRVIRATEVWE